MGAKSWEKPQNRPDWTDIFCLMKAIESLHSVVVTMSMCSTVFDGPLGMITLTAFHVPKEASVLGQPILGMSGEYPCQEHRDLESCVFAALYLLDSRLTEKLWQQSQLPFTADLPRA